MTSIRSYQGEIRLCASCAQPAYQLSDTGYGPMWMHFKEQHKGVRCPGYPSAEAGGEPIAVKWHPESLADVRHKYGA